MIHTADWFVLFVFGCSLLGLLVSGVLFFANKNASFQAKLLAGFLTSVSLVALNNALMATDFYLKVPHLWRVISLVSFLPAPLSLLYVRAVLRQEYRFRRSDIWFFVPTVVYFFTMLPFYLQPAQAKLELVQRMVLNSNLIALEPENLIPWGIPTAARTLYGMGTTAAAGIMLVRWKRKYGREGWLQQDNAAQFRWLVFFTAVVGLLFTIGTLIIIAHVFYVLTQWELMALVISISVLFICTSLLARPAILYGMRGWFQQPAAPDAAIPQAVPQLAPAAAMPLEIAEAASPIRKTTLTPDQGAEIRQVLEACLQNKKPFLQPNFKLAQLSTETGIPTYLLSAFINQEYGKNFSELINDHRVDYLYQLLQTNGQQYEQFTLEALGKMAGFNSRNAFIASVKRKTGLTPSEYFQLEQVG